MFADNKELCGHRSLRSLVRITPNIWFRFATPKLLSQLQIFGFVYLKQNMIDTITKKSKTASYKDGS